jgi:hypothetical protein
MDNFEKFSLACEQFGSLQHRNPPMKVDWLAGVAWSLLFDEGWEKLYGRFCLVYLEVENRIGIASIDKGGFTPTMCTIYEGVKGRDVVRWFNERILDISEDRENEIVMNSFRKPVRNGKMRKGKK